MSSASGKPSRHWDSIARLVTLLTLVLAVFNTFRSCTHDSQLNTLQERVNAMQYRPRIAVAGPLAWSTLKFIPESVGRTAETLDFYVNVRLEGVLNVFNAGNAIAQVVARMSGDTAAGSYKLRDLLLAGDLPNPSWDQLQSYGRDCVAPGETLRIPVGHTFAHIDPDSGAVLHYLLLYENEQGQLYDSYFWVRVRLPAPFHVVAGGKLVSPKISIGQPSDASLPYGKRTARAVRRHLDEVARRLGQNQGPK